MGSKSFIAALAVALATALSPADTHAQFIGVFADPAASSCDLSLTPLLPDYVYIVATLGPLACSGVQGAEFRIEGLPVGWVAAPTSDPPVPSALIGDPFSEGVHLAYPACMTAESGVVLLLTVLVIPTTPVTDLELNVIAHSTPSMPEFPCPLVRLCDAPTYTPLCVQGWASVINREFLPWCCQDACAFSTCPPVAVAPATWSGVKSLYAPP